MRKAFRSILVLDVFAVLSHEGFPSGGGELVDSILVEGLPVGRGKVDVWPELDDQDGSVLHDYFASVDGSVGDQANALAGDFTDFEGRRFGVGFGEGGEGVEDIDVSGSANENEAIADGGVGKVAVFFDALADCPWCWDLNIIRCRLDL